MKTNEYENILIFIYVYAILNYPTERRENNENLKTALVAFGVDVQNRSIHVWRRLCNDQSFGARVCRKEKLALSR